MSDSDFRPAALPVQNTRQVAVYGGSFNPVHYGHLKTAAFVLDNLDISTVYLMPNSNPPHKNSKLNADISQRLDMLNLAVKDFGNENLGISEAECDTSVRHYTCDSLEKLQQKYPHAELFFIMGMDSLYSLDTWKNGFDLIEMANIIVLKRPSYPFDALPDNIRKHMDEKHRFRYIPLDSPDFSVSSTEIRNALMKLRTPDKFDFSGMYRSYLKKTIPPSVLDYILEHNLYT